MSISAVTTNAAEGGMAALTSPIDSLDDDNDLHASNVVDFTPFNEVILFEPIFMTRSLPESLSF
jgi:hypothetical protein